MFYPIIKKLFFLGGFTALAGLCMVQIHDGVYVNTSEFGALELLQLAILGVSILVGIITLMRLHTTEYNRLNLTMGWLLLLLTVAIFGRETSWGSAYGIADSLSDSMELVGIIIITLIVLSLAMGWLLREQDKRRFIMQALRLPVVPIFLTALGFVLIGDFFEKEHFNFSYNQFLEEGYECLGYATFLYGYIVYARTFFVKK